MSVPEPHIQRNKDISSFEIRFARIRAGIGISNKVFQFPTVGQYIFIEAGDTDTILYTPDIYIFSSAQGAPTIMIIQE
jgi:hypothetical protein